MKRPAAAAGRLVSATAASALACDPRGVVSGKVAMIAHELGVSRSWASRKAHALEARKLADAREGT